jgi:hypothetical protein
MILDTKIQDLPKSIRSVPIRELESDTKLWVATTFLATAMGTFSDGITIMENNKRIGYFGSKQLLEYLQKYPISSTLVEKMVKDLPKRDLTYFSTSDTLSDIFNEWKRTRFAYSVIQDNEHFFAISIRSMLAFVELYDLPNKISEIPKKDIITYNNDDTIKTIFDKMFQYKCRRLVHEHTLDVLSDRIIIDDICGEFDYLKNIPDFLQIKAKSFNAKKTKEITQNSKITDVAHEMLREEHPIMISERQIISPWDVVLKFFEAIDKK